MEYLSCPLDDNEIVVMWGQEMLKDKSSLSQWKITGRVSLYFAKKFWKWSIENRGKTFPNSIWRVTEETVFPLNYKMTGNEFEINESD